MNEKVFLCHNSEDKPAVRRLAEKLEDAGIDIWLDEWCLAPGDRWQVEIEQALNQCQVCAVFLGSNPIGTWQHEELQVVLGRRASDKQFRVIPVLLPKTERAKRSLMPAFLANTHWVAFQHDIEEEEKFNRLVAGIKGKPYRNLRTNSYTNSCPYRGLRTFNISDAPYFFGREALTDWLVADVKRLIHSDSEPRFLAIVGASGSGKSSVARAGLLYELEQGAIEGSGQWDRIIINHPGADPVTELFTLGAKAMGLPSDAMALERDFIKPICQEANHQNKLHLQTAVALANQPEKRLLVFIDQFEEVFTACTDTVLRKRFVDLLLYAARAPKGKVIIIITIRLDFLGKCIEHPELAGFISGGIELVDPMNDQELEAAIVQPAAQAGVGISDSLVQTLIQAVRKQPGSLPLLEHVLEELWHKKAADKQITDNDYTTGILGINGALARHANTILVEKCGDKQNQEQVLTLISRMVHISDRASPETDTRLRYRIGDADYLKLTPFVDAHLLITSNDAGNRIIEVAHEALIRHWPELQARLQDIRDLRIWQQSIKSQLEIWRKSKDESEFTDENNPFLSGIFLKQGQQWLDDQGTELTDEEKLFIGKSRQFEKTHELRIWRQKVREHYHKWQQQHQT